MWNPKGDLSPFYVSWGINKTEIKEQPERIDKITL
jgi:hypothetical protein